jgi:hypothetical protein
MVTQRSMTTQKGAGAVHASTAKRCSVAIPRCENDRRRGGAFGVIVMMNAQSTTLFASSFARQLPTLGAPPVDLATAKALRKSTAKASRHTQRRNRRSLTELFMAPLICTIPTPEAPQEAPETKPSVLLMATEESAITPRPRGSLAQRLATRIQVDLAWLTAMFVALLVTAALAIPLALFRQNG